MYETEYYGAAFESVESYTFTEDDVLMLREYHGLYLSNNHDDHVELDNRFDDFINDEEDDLRKEAILHVLSHHVFTWPQVNAGQVYYHDTEEN